MKKIAKYLFMSVAWVCFFACNKAQEIEQTNHDEAPVQEVQYVTYTCSIAEPDSKVTIDDDGVNKWKVGDVLFIHGQYKGSADKDGDSVAELYSTEVTLDGVTNTISLDGKTATFTIPALVPYDKSGSGYKSTLYAAYPADACKSFDDGDELGYYNYFTETNRPLMAGYNEEGGTHFVFQNLCTVITFSVDAEVDVNSYEFYGNSGETVGHGYRKVKVCDPIGSSNYAYSVSDPKTVLSGTVTPGEKCFIYIPNGVTFSNGFTIELKKNGSSVKMASTKGEIVLSRNMILPLGNITSRLKAADLSKREPANCYLVNYPSTYKFQTVQGNTRTSVGSVDHARVLWETYNNNTAVTEGSVVTGVSYANGYISFTIPNPVVPGNALIAAEDNENKILWSWHIWVPETQVTSGTYGISTPEMMDRNLGALVVAGSGSVQANGLFYQWGRKDPFLGIGAQESSTFATRYGTGFSITDAAVSGIAYSIANPTEFIIAKGNMFSGDGTTEKKQDWLVTTDATRWGSSKTIYDPCPAGWKVPSSSSCTIFSSGNNPHQLTGFNYDAANYCVTIGTAVFPLTGRISYSGSMEKYKTDAELGAFVWTATSTAYGDTYEGCATWMDVRGATSSNHYSERKARGACVRCVKE